MPNSTRNSRGNMLVLASVATLGILVALLLLVMNFGRVTGGAGEHRTAIEAAALAAATDLARIVIDDPNYGFISLGDHPPIGRRTVARDGEPLPVMGINTILGTARLDYIIAREINDQTMIQLAQQDITNAKAAATRLQTALNDAIKPGAQTEDFDGMRVTPYERALALYENNLVKMTGGKLVTGSFKLSLGWLEGGASTVTPVPDEARLPDAAKVPPDKQLDGNYKAFVNVPAHGTNFYFAGMGNRISLVDQSKFKAPQAEIFCSVVRAEADQTVESIDGRYQGAVTHAAACALPLGHNDVTPAGVLSVAFPDGLVPGVEQLRDLFGDNQLKSRTGKAWVPQNGDWPLDQGSSLTTATNLASGSPTTTQAWSTGFYHWLRTARTRPRPASVLAMLDKDFNATIVDGISQVTLTSANLIPPAYAGTITDDTPTAMVNDLRINERYNAIIANQQPAKNGYWRSARQTKIRPQLPDNTPSVNCKKTGELAYATGIINPQTMIDFHQAISNTNAAALTTLALCERIESDIAAGQLTLSAGQLQNLNNAKRNALKVSQDSNYVINHQLILTAMGLKQINSNYELARQTLRPKPRPAANINEILTGNDSSGGDPNDKWSSSNFASFYVDNKPDQAAGAFLVDRDGFDGATFLFRFDSTGQVVVNDTDGTPFATVPVSENQTYFVNLDAMQTGNPQIPVTWTSTMRDESGNMGNTLGGKHAGQPLAGGSIDWCQRSDLAVQGGSDGVSFESPTQGHHSTGGSAGNPGGANPQQTPLVNQVTSTVGQLFGLNGTNSSSNNTPSPGGSGTWGTWTDQQGNPINTTIGGKTVPKWFICGGLAVDFQLRAPLILRPANLNPGPTVNVRETPGGYAEVTGVRMPVAGLTGVKVLPGAQSGPTRKVTSAPGNPPMIVEPDVTDDVQ
ncbi:MAG: hypothetical protein U0105_08790 [Candidatus Obscuribacterales bacterium]|jgi:hypothetical protein